MPFQFRDRCLLMVGQTQEVHEQIAALLAALRRQPGRRQGREELAPAQAAEDRCPRQ